MGTAGATSLSSDPWLYGKQVINEERKGAEKKGDLSDLALFYPWSDPASWDCTQDPGVPEVTRPRSHHLTSQPSSRRFFARAASLGRVRSE